MEQGQRGQNGSLQVDIQERRPYLCGRWQGSGGAEHVLVAEQAAARLRPDPGVQLVLQLGELADAEPPVVEILVRCTRVAQSDGCAVTLVRCREGLYQDMVGAGLDSAVTHSATLWSATHGLLGDPAVGADLHFRGTVDMLARVRALVRALLNEVGVGEPAALELELAIHEAVANAVRHGCPQAAKNRVRLSLQVEGDCLLADVSDQGPGFPALGMADPTQSPPDRGLGLRIMRSVMDQVEFFPGDRGLLVRLTRRLDRRGAGAE